MTKTNISHIILISLAFLTLIMPTAIGAEVSIADTQANLGTTKTVPIILREMTNFGTATLELSYNTSVVTVLRVESGDVGTPYTQIDNSLGKTKITVYVSTATGPDSPLTLANIVFSGIGIGKSPLNLSIRTLADADGNRVTATASNGSFTAISTISTTTSVQIGDAQANIGTTKTVPIILSEMKNFGTATLELSYNTSIVTVLRVESGDVGMPSANINNTLGKTKITVYVSTATGPDSPFTLANIVFSASGIGKSPLNISIITLADADGNRVTANTSNGSFTAISTISNITSVQIADTQANIGTTKTVPIILREMKNFGTATLELSYNPSVVTVQSIESGDVGMPSANIDNTVGKTKITVYVSTATGPDSPLTLVNIVFSASGIGKSPLNISIITLADADGNRVSATANNGWFTVTSSEKGDFNGNGRVDIGDVTYVAYMVVGKVPVDLSADFNGNGRVDIGDATKIAYYLVGKIDKL